MHTDCSSTSKASNVREANNVLLSLGLIPSFPLSHYIRGGERKARGPRLCMSTMVSGFKDLFLQVGTDSLQLCIARVVSSCLDHTLSCAELEQLALTQLLTMEHWTV